jgi:hypothetical protein
MSAVTANARQCLIGSVDCDAIETIDGESYDASASGEGAITWRMRSRSDFAVPPASRRLTRCKGAPQ